MNEIKQAKSTAQKNKGIFKKIYQEGGQAMVETAFVMIFLLALLSVVIDAGRAFFTYLALQNAAGEGAYYAAKDPRSLDSNDHPDPNNITFRVKNESPDSALIDWDTDDVQVAVIYFCPDGESRNQLTVPSGAFVEVTVEHQFETIGPVAGVLAVLDVFSGWDGTFRLRAKTKQIVLEAPGNTSDPC